MKRFKEIIGGGLMLISLPLIIGAIPFMVIYFIGLYLSGETSELF